MIINNPTVRLINPAKNKLGRISKAMLDTANKSIREADTDTVLDWFKGICNKHLCKFVVFDIKGTVKWAEPCKYVILLASRILWHKRINPSLKV